MGSQAYWREWDLIGLEVTQVRFDHRVEFHAWSPERDLLVTFSSPVTLRYTDGRVVDLDPEQSEYLCPMLSLLFRLLMCFRVSSEGQCCLRFIDGVEVSCEPNEQYEAWESKGSGPLADASLLCAPGGGSPWGNTIQSVQ